MKEILFNSSTNVVGGGAKNAFLFIKYIVNNPVSKNWHFAVSEEVLALLNDENIPILSSIHLFKKSPSTSFSARTKLRKLVVKLEIDVVYTMAGPAYVDFDCFHVMGISNPYITHVDYGVLRMKLLECVMTRLRVAYQSYWAQRADYFIFQTTYSRDSWLLKQSNREIRTTVVPNAFDMDYIKAMKEISNSEEDSSINYVFIPGSAFPHKNHALILELIRVYEHELRGLRIVFMTTLAKDSTIACQLGVEIAKLDCEDLWVNLGNIPYTKVVDIYERARIVLVASLLETFSATYLEALISRKPVIVLDVPFAREICGNYAIYVPVKDMVRLMAVFRRVISNGLNGTPGALEFVESNFISSAERNRKLLNFLESIE